MDWRWLLFSFVGRINRAKFLVAVLITFGWQIVWVFLWAVVGVTFDLDTNHLAETLLPIPFSFVFVTDDPPLKAASLALVGTIPINVAFAWAVAAALVKRLHDHNRSGWWAIPLFGVPYLYLQYMRISFNLDVPIAPPILLIVILIPVSILGLWGFIELYFLMGTDGRNRFGPDPLSRAAAAAPTDPRPDQMSVPRFLVRRAASPPGPHAGPARDQN